MGACRRILAGLLFVLWSSAGVAMHRGAHDRSHEAGQRSHVRSSTWRREAEAHQAQKSAREHTMGSGDESVLQWVFEPFAGAMGRSQCALASAKGRPPTVRGPLTGRPRGPPLA